MFVVEDDRDISALIEHYLQKAGYRVEIASSGDEVIARVRQESPDLLLLDLMLPGMDGLEICRTLRGDARTALVPIIMVTARAEDSDRIVGLTGPEDEIDKVVRDWGALAERVNQDDGGYLMNHTASVFLVNSKGEFAGTIAYGENTDTALEKIKRLVANS